MSDRRKEGWLLLGSGGRRMRFRLHIRGTLAPVLMNPSKRRYLRQKRLTAIDLFAGCGGLTTGLKRAGFKVVGAVEVDEVAAKTYQRNHRSVRLWTKDIRELPAVRVKQALGLKSGELSLLAGCPPCQGFSSLRRLNGGRYVRDERNSLLMDFLRFVRVLKPRSLMLENVPGIASYWRMALFRQSLMKLGYTSTSEVLDAAAYGVPQRRRRFILVASRFGEPPELAKPSATRITVRQAIGALGAPGSSGDPAHDAGESRSPRVAAMIRSIPVNGGSRESLGVEGQLACHRLVDGFHDVYGRMSWDDVAPTITSGCVNPSKGRFLHPRQNRTITVREAAILQGFPAAYFISMERGKFFAAQMIGNALPPEFIRRHAAVLRRHLEAHRLSDLRAEPN